MGLGDPYEVRVSGFFTHRVEQSENRPSLPGQSVRVWDGKSTSNAPGYGYPPTWTKGCWGRMVEDFVLEDPG